MAVRDRCREALLRVKAAAIARRRRRPTFDELSLHVYYRISKSMSGSAIEIPKLGGECFVREADERY